MRKYFIAIFFAFIFLLINQRNSLALGISPPLYDYSLEPGQTITGDATVYNNDDFKSTYQFKAVNIEYVGEDSRPQFNIFERPTSDTLAAWIKVTPPIATLNAMSKTAIRFTVSVPYNAAPGTHTAVLFAMDPATANAKEGANLGIGKQIGLTFVVTVKGDTTQKPEFKDFELVNGINIAGIRIVNTLPADFETRLYNGGNKYYMPQGKVIIRNGSRTKIVKNLELNPFFNRVLPNKTRLYANQFLKNENTYHKYKTATNDPFIKKGFKYLSYIVTNFSLGKYNAELTVDTHVDGQKQIVYGEQINFIVFPYKAVFVMIVITGILFVIKYRPRRRKIKKKKN